MVFLLFAGVRSSTPVIHPVFAGVRSPLRSFQCLLYCFLLRFRRCFLVQHHLVVVFVLFVHPSSILDSFSFVSSCFSVVLPEWYLWGYCIFVAVCLLSGVNSSGSLLLGLYVFPQTSQSFSAYITGQAHERSISCVVHCLSERETSVVRLSYLSSTLWRRQAFLSFVWSVSGLVCGKGYGVPGVFLLSLVYGRRRTPSFICWFPGESDFAHIIVYNMLSPFII
jgi:hypothetical protein